MQRTIDEARLASIKLRTWTEAGIYSRLFDRHTNIRTDNNWLFFNLKGLSSDPKLETAMSMLIASRCSTNAGRYSIRRRWLQKSCNYFGPHASGTRVYGESLRRLKTSSEHPCSHGHMVQGSSRTPTPN